MSTRSQRGLIEAVAGVLLVAVLLVLGSPVSLLPSGAYLLAAIAAVVAGLFVHRPGMAAVIALIGVALGSAATHVVTAWPWSDVSSWAIFAAKSGLCAGAGAAGIGWLCRRAPSLRPLVSWMGVAIVVATAWIVVITYSAAPYQAGDPLDRGLVQLLQTAPAITQASSDTELYQAYVQGVAQGRGYYETAREVLTYRNQVSSLAVATGSPSAFRQPLLYVVLGWLGVGWPTVFAGLGVMTLAIIAAFILARGFVDDPVALVGTVAVGVFLAEYVSTINVLDAELWAGMFALCAVALASIRTSSARTTILLHCGAAAAAFLAAATRELITPVILLAIAATLSNTTLRRAGVWIPWVVALGAVVLAFAAHVWAVQPYLVPVPGIEARVSDFYQPDGQTIVASVNLVAHALQTRAGVAWVLCALGVAGSLVAAMGSARRILIAGTVAGGVAVLAIFRSPGAGVEPYEVTAHWALLILPTLLACAPLILSRVPTRSP